MNQRISIIVGLTTLWLLATVAVSLAQEPNEPPTNMHTTDVDHQADKERSVKFKDEAEQLRAQAASHRKLAQLYRNRIPVKPPGNHKSVAKHCDSLAEKYEEAAKEAEAVAAELAK